MADGNAPQEGVVRPGDAAANRRMMDRIAKPFDESRRDPWEPVEAFLRGLPKGARVVDLAGGNGRHSVAAHRAGLRPVVADISDELARLAVRHGRDAGFHLAAVEADALHLPFRESAFHHALFVAGLHAIRGRAARVRALREMQRVVEPGGQALVTVWSAEQERFRDIVSGQRRADAMDALTADTEVGDVMVPWSKGVDEPVERFFHVYTDAELRRELEDAGLKVDRIETLTLTKSSAPDNIFAYVTVR